MDRKAGNDLVCPPGQAAQHGRSVSGIDRLAEDRRVADHHRVPANEPAARYLAARGNGKGLGFAEPNDMPLGGFPASTVSSTAAGTVRRVIPTCASNSLRRGDADASTTFEYGIEISLDAFGQVDDHRLSLGNGRVIKHRAIAALLLGSIEDKIGCG